MKFINLTILAILLSFSSFAILPITGSVNVCVGATTTLSDATPGGTWSSSSTGIASIGSVTGVVTGVSAGIVTITYTVGAGNVTTSLSVNATPGAIVGSTVVCAGHTTALSDPSTGGTWATSNPVVATVGSTTGLVTGLTPGACTIYYSYPVTGCSSIYPDTVLPSPAAISGPSSVCLGSTITVTDVTTGGIWASSAPAVATIGASTGVVTGLTLGTTTISYVLPGTGCATTMVVTVVATPAVTASASLGCGGTYTITASGAGTSGYYAWSPSTGLSCPTCAVVTTNPTATTVYTVYGTSSAGCTGSGTVTVNGNRIRGYVTPAVAGSIRVWLIQFNWADSSIITTDSVMTCLSGGTPYYEFTSPAAGNYRVKAYLLGGTPGASGYIPTYSASTPYWYLSDTIPHSTSTDTMHVNMIYGTVPAGPGFISGYVVSGAGKGTSGEVPAVGMLVYLRDGSGNVLTYTHTDGTGAYSFSSLAYGTYGIYPEAYKYYTTPSAAITLNSTTPSVTSVGFKQHTTFGTITPFVVTTIPSKGITGDLSVFPNPASNELTIKGITGNSQYRILTVTGTSLATGVLVTGANTISTLNIATGMYILEIQNEKGEKSNIRVVKE